MDRESRKSEGKESEAGSSPGSTSDRRRSENRDTSPSRERRKSGHRRRSIEPNDESGSPRDDTSPSRDRRKSVPPGHRRKSVELDPSSPQEESPASRDRRKSEAADRRRRSLEPEELSPVKDDTSPIRERRKSHRRKDDESGSPADKDRRLRERRERRALKERSDVEAIAGVQESIFSKGRHERIFVETEEPTDFRKIDGEGQGAGADSPKRDKSRQSTTSSGKRRQSLTLEQEGESSQEKAEQRERQKSIVSGEEGSSKEKRRKSRTGSQNADGEGGGRKSVTSDDVEGKRRGSARRDSKASKSTSKTKTVSKGSDKEGRASNASEKFGSKSSSRTAKMMRDINDPRKQRIVPKRSTSVFVSSTDNVKRDSLDEEYLRRFSVGPKYTKHEVPSKERIFWMTNQISNDFKADEGKVLANLAEFLMFVIFLILLSVVAFYQDPAHKYHMERGIRRQLVDKSFRTFKTQDSKMTFYDIRENNHIWHYLNMSLIDGEWLDHFYGPERVKTRQEVEIKPFWHIMGVPQLRQLRVTNSSCQIHPIFKESIAKCFDYFNGASEKTATIYPVQRAFYFDPDLTQKYNALHWEWVSGKWSHHVDFSTPLGTYSGGGYLVNLTRGDESERENKRMFNYLREFVWLNRETRVLFVDFTIYNPNVKLMSAVKLAFEIPPTGGVYPSWDIKTVQMFHLVTKMDYFIFGVLGALVLFGAFLVVEEIREIAYFRGRYLLQLWTYVDVAIVILIFLAVICLIKVLSQVTIGMDYYTQNLNEFFCMDDLIFIELLYDRVLIAIYFLAFLRVLRYLGFFGTIHQYYDTISKCKLDLLCFGLSYFMIFFAFAQIGFFLFGRFNEDFQSLERSMFTLVRVFFGYIQYKHLVSTNRMLGPIYFVAFSIIVYYLMMSMFLIILYQNYVEQEAEILVRKGPTAGRIMISFCQRIMMLLFKRPLPPMPLEYITVGEVKDALAKLHFTEPEIDVFMRKFAIDEKKTVEPQDVPKIIRELLKRGVETLQGEQKEQKLLPEMTPKKTKHRQLLAEEYQALVTKIDQIELQVETFGERIIGIVNLLAEGTFLHDPVKNPQRPA